MNSNNNRTIKDQQNVLKKSLPALEKLCTSLAAHILDRKASVLGRPYIMAGSLVMKAQLGEFEGHTEELGALLHELKDNVEGFWASLPKELPNKLATLLKTAQAVTPAYGSNRATDKPSAA